MPKKKKKRLEPAVDLINQPPSLHPGCYPEPIDYIRAHEMSFCEG